MAGLLDPEMLKMDDAQIVARHATHRVCSIKARLSANKVVRSRYPCLKAFGLFIRRQHVSGVQGENGDYGDKSPWMCKKLCCHFKVGSILSRGHQQKTPISGRKQRVLCHCCVVWREGAVDSFIFIIY